LRHFAQSTAKTAIIVLLAGLPAIASFAAPPAGMPPAQPQAGSSTMTPQGPETPAGRPRPPTAATLAFQEVTRQISPDMNIRYSNDVDKDFATLLAACQKGMAGLARIELQHGKDHDMRKLAEHLSAGPGHPVAATGSPGADAGSSPDTSQAYSELMGTLQTDVQIRYSNNTDKDFAALLVAYRKFAVSLAGLELRDGKDAKTRHTAEKLISDDQHDAGGLAAWRAKHG